MQSTNVTPLGICSVVGAPKNVASQPFEPSDINVIGVVPAVYDSISEKTTANNLLSLAFGNL